jgi:hypothetical protein
VPWELQAIQKMKDKPLVEPPKPQDVASAPKPAALPKPVEPPKLEQGPLPDVKLIQDAEHAHPEEKKTDGPSSQPEQTPPEASKTQ